MTDTKNLTGFDRYRDLIDDWPAFAEACQRPLPTVLWANPLRCRQLERLNASAGLVAVAGDDAADTGGPRNDGLDAGKMLAARLQARGYRCEEVGWYPGALRVRGLRKPGLTLEYYLGLYHVQEEMSLLPALVLEPMPQDRVLDLCAAPGGKTALIACRMQNRGTVVANDARTSRLRAVRANCERLGLLNVVVTAHDGTRYPLEVGTFERVLLDAPCSCEGNIRQQKDLSWQPPGEFLTGRSGLQATLLGRAWKLLAPGGTLVYATCTFAPEENERVLDYTLGEDATIVPFRIEGLDAAPGLTEWQGRELRPDCANVARYWPHLNDTGGFTVACVRKGV